MVITSLSFFLLDENFDKSTIILHFLIVSCILAKPLQQGG